MKTPGEVLDYTIDFSDWFVGRADSAASVAVTADVGITVVGTVLAGPVAVITLGGGTDQTQYKVACQLTTTTNRVREADFLVKVEAA